MGRRDVCSSEGLSISKTASLVIAHLVRGLNMDLILFEAKKIRFDHNSIDLLLSKDA